MFLHYSSIVRIDNIPVIQYSRSPLGPVQKWQVSKPARRFVIPWQPETPPRSSRLVFMFLRATCQLVPTLARLLCTLWTTRDAARYLQLDTSIHFQEYSRRALCSPRATPNALTHPRLRSPFLFRVSFRSRSSPNYVSVSEDRFLFRYPTLPGEIESAFGGEASRTRKIIPPA